MSRVIGVVVATLLALVALLALYLRLSADSVPAPAPDSPAQHFKPVRHGQMPDFSRPEDAKRYLDEVTKADRRELARIDAALKAARARPHPDQAQIAELERQRAARAARLGYHSAARDKLGK